MRDENSGARPRPRRAKVKKVAMNKDSPYDRGFLSNYSKYISFGILEIKVIDVFVHLKAW